MSNTKRLQALGLDQKEITQKVTVMDQATITERINSLQEMPFDQFNKLLLLKPNTVMDKEIIVDSVTDCSKGEKEQCKNVLIIFNILFNYEIGGFRTNTYIHTLEKQDKHISILSIKERILRRKGGLFHLNVRYNHHTTFCKSSFIGSTIKRTPFSLMIPDYDEFIAKRINVIDIGIFFKELTEMRETEIPSLKTLNELTERFGSDGCEIDHSEDFCSIGDEAEEDHFDYCDDPHYENEEEYCLDACDNQRDGNKLGYMLTHPHFFANMDNFCTGNQFSSNPVFLELQKYPNPISYIAETIRLTNDVNMSDSYFSDRYMVDVFQNFGAFNVWDESVSKMKDQSHFYYSRASPDHEGTIHSSKDHCLTYDCFCMDCLTFRFWVTRGLKFDPSKLIIGEIIEVNKDKFVEAIEYQYGNGTINRTDLAHLLDYSNVDLSNEEYHCKDITAFDQLNSGFSTSDFKIGLFTNKKTNRLVLLSKAKIDGLYEQYETVIKLKDEIRNISPDTFTETEYKHIEKIFIDINDGFNKIKRKTKINYVKGLYKQIVY